MAQRVLAVLGAIGLVLAAIAVRSVIDDDGGDDDPSGSESAGAEVVCAVQPACNELVGGNVRSASAASVLSDLEDGEADDVDVWVTTSAWVEIIEARAPGVINEVRSLATSPVVVAALPQRSGAIESACGDRLWACLGEASGSPWSELGGESAWGSLTVALTDPEAAHGLPVLASAAAGYFGNLDFASNDFDDAFRSWLGNLSGDQAENSPVRVMVTATGSYSAAGSALAQARLDAGSRGIEILNPEPAVTATVVAVRFNDSRFPDLSPVTDALIEGGWAAVDHDPPPATLKPGVMAALHTVWTEVR